MEGVVTVPDGDAVSRLDAVLKRCEEATAPIAVLLPSNRPAEQNQQRYKLVRTDLPDLARDFRTVAEAYLHYPRLTVDEEIAANVAAARWLWIPDE